LIKVYCKNCGKAKFYEAKHARNAIYSQIPIDPNYGLQLWLQSGVDGSTLWAYNSPHLDFLEGFVSAKLREEKVVSQHSLSQTMPSFISKDNNRTKLLKLISRMRKTIK
jgi:hypothetical protein